MKWQIVGLAAALGLVLAACGGDSNGDPEPSITSNATSTADGSGTAGASTTASAPAGSASPGGTASATVTPSAGVSGTATPSSGATGTPGADPTGGSAEPTPTAPPSATGTAAAPATAELGIRNAAWYVDTVEALVVTGEVTNGLGEAASYVQVTVSYLSSSGAELGSDFTLAGRDVIPAGEDAPFRIYTFDPPEGVADIRLSITDSVVPPPAEAVTAAGLAASVTASSVDENLVLHITGTVTNSGSTAYQGVVAWIALYDAEGKVIRVEVAYTDPPDLAPGESAPFDAAFYEDEGFAFSSYRAWVSASPTAPEPVSEDE